MALCLHAAANAQQTPPLPSFAELEAGGARVGKISICTEDVFDTADPREDKLLFRWAKALHI